MKYLTPAVASLVILAITAFQYAWPRPLKWAARNSCGSYCVRLTCPLYFRVRVTWHDPLSGADDSQWSVNVFNDSNGAVCVFNHFQR